MSEPVENDDSFDQDEPANDFAMEPVSSHVSESISNKGSAPSEAEIAQSETEAATTQSEAPEDHVLAATSQRSPAVPPQLRSEPPMCQPIALGGVVITPPVIHRQMEFCTAPSGTVRIATIELHEPGKGPAPSNDQSSQQASGEH